jgi:hypothetical protein
MSTIEEYPKMILGLFAVIGMATKLILSAFVSSSDGSIGSATGAIWGNLIIILSILSYLCIDDMKELLVPVSIFIMVLLWDLSISYKYFERINKNEMPDIYYYWNYLSNLMITSFVIVLVLNNINVGLGDNTSKIMNIVSVIGLITIGIQQTILDNFMVDKDVSIV